ncbi:MAG: DNA polymerase Y family protein, partial [Dehalococcoidia bacterium]|nr:DNA polymerase Y family protein [Dehalococcoidia bacterium]
MRVACVLIPHFAVQVELRRHPHLLDRPVLIVRRQGTRPVVLDAPPSAGIPPGTPLQTAQARCKDAVLVEADPSAYEEAWKAVLNSLEQRSPIVEDAGLGCAYIDLAGLDALYGGSARAASAVLGAAPLQ